MLSSRLVQNGQIFWVRNRMGFNYWVQKLYAVNEMYEVALSILKTSVFHVFVSDTNISSLATDVKYVFLLIATLVFQKKNFFKPCLLCH